MRDVSISLWVSLGPAKFCTKRTGWYIILRELPLCSSPCNRHLLSPIPSFWILFVTNVAQGLPVFISPLIRNKSNIGLIDAFAVKRSVRQREDTCNGIHTGASVLCLTFLSWVSDRFDLRISMLVSTLGSTKSFAVFLLWAFP
ncbi:hypothetical protein C8J57DRAFT_680645 [Mycena rebaudengoi]|nr:hypothetical protein C8J57DRAFT_680645 [Mycena rebaudengoi]